MGFVDGAAPPFILLAIATAIMASLLTLSAYTSTNPALRAKAQALVQVYFLAAVMAVALLVTRIVVRGSLEPQEGATFFDIWDSVVLSVMAFTLSSFLSLAALMWRLYREEAEL